MRWARRWPGSPTGRWPRWCRGSRSWRAPTRARGTRLDTARQLLDEFGGPFEELLIYAWRRHLAAAVARIEALGANEEDLSTSQVSVGFADIVSFTALSNEITPGADR